MVPTDTHIAQQVPQEVIQRARLEVVAGIEARMDSLLDAMMDAYRAEISAYRLDDPAIMTEVRKASRMNVFVSMEMMAHGLEPSESIVAALRELGRERALQGFPLHHVIQAYQVGGRIVWEVVVDEVNRRLREGHVAAAVLGQLSHVIMQYTAFISAEVARSYTETQRDSAAVEQRRKWEVFDELLTGNRTTAELTERAQQAGVDLGEQHVVALFAIEQLPSLDRITAENLRHSARERLQQLNFGGRVAPLVQARGNAVVAICAVSADTVAETVRTALSRAVKAMRIPDSVEWIAVTGRPQEGLDGIHRSHQDALRSLEAARAERLIGNVYTYLELAPAMLLGADDRVTEDLRCGFVEPLLKADAERDHRLIETLEVYLDEGRNILATAKRLFVHRQTLATRLKRIETLLGLDLRDRRHILLVELALEAQRRRDRLSPRLV